MSGDKDMISYKSLLQISYQNCEFCDKTFWNRYQCITHNASHIIIPLIRLDFYQCERCSENFTTQEKLLMHTIAAHPVNVQLQEVKCEFISQDAPESHSKGEEISIRDRIMFENDTDYISILNNLTSDCKVAVETFDPPWKSPRNVRKDKSTMNDTSCIDVTGIPTVDLTVDLYEHHTEAFGSLKEMDVTCYSKASESLLEVPGLQRLIKYNCIPYDELVRPISYMCRHCRMSFPNRYTMIQHNLDHIKFRKLDALVCTLCDNYYTDSKEALNAHIKHTHANIKVTAQQVPKCKKCGLRYKDYMKHVKYNHYLECYHCGLEFEKKLDFYRHIMTIHDKSVKLINMCDFCYSFLKRTTNLKYTFTGLKVGNGRREKCYGCGKLFFEVNVVERSCKKHIDKYTYKARPSSNEVRLKNIQQRLKLMKQLCYMLFYYQSL